MFKMMDNKASEAEPFAEEAKYFTESRLLQRDVKIVMEGVSNQNILGSVLHPVRNASLATYTRHNIGHHSPDCKIFIYSAHKGLETACHSPITFHYNYNTMSYQIKKNCYAFSNTLI